MTQRKVYWMGTPPQECDVCHQPFADKFTDGKTIWGPWANMCPDCFARVGIGLGLGRGQEYRLQANKSWLKVKG